MERFLVLNESSITCYNRFIVTNAMLKMHKIVIADLEKAAKSL